MSVGASQPSPGSTNPAATVAGCHLRVWRWMPRCERCRPPCALPTAFALCNLRVAQAIREGPCGDLPVSMKTVPSPLVPGSHARAHHPWHLLKPKATCKKPALREGGTVPFGNSFQVWVAVKVNVLLNVVASDGGPLNLNMLQHARQHTLRRTVQRARCNHCCARLACRHMQTLGDRGRGTDRSWE
jgi:hypothetical protein